jgi:hypothetical protein
MDLGGALAVRRDFCVRAPRQLTHAHIPLPPCASHHALAVALRLNCATAVAVALDALTRAALRAPAQRQQLYSMLAVGCSMEQVLDWARRGIFGEALEGVEGGACALHACAALSGEEGCLLELLHHMPRDAVALAGLLRQRDGQGRTALDVARVAFPGGGVESVLATLGAMAR